MQINWELVYEIAKILIAIFVGAWINRKFERRAHLVVYLGHIAHHKIDKDTIILTWSVVLRNSGKLAAHNVRVKHSIPPMHFEIRPPRPYLTEAIDDGGQDIVFDKVVPKEELYISYIRNLPVGSSEPAVINRGISCDEGGPQVLNYIPMRQYPIWLQRMSGIFVLIGVIATVYLVWELVSWMYKWINMVLASG